MATDIATEAYRRRPDALADDRGDGPPLLLAHGTLMDRTMFRPQLRALADDYRVAAYDLRARTQHWRGPYDLDDLVADCRAVVDGLGMDAPVLGGMSMGGFMALRFALAHPDRVSGLVLIDAVAEAHTPAEREQYGEMVADLPEAERVPEQLAETVSHILFGATTVADRPDLVESWVDRWRTYVPAAVHHEVHSWLDRPDVTDRLDEIEVPVLAVHGAEDAALAPERAEPMVDALPNATLETVPGAGHSSNLERPEPVTDAIRAFLERVH